MSFLYFPGVFCMALCLTYIRYMFRTVGHGRSTRVGQSDILILCLLSLQVCLVLSGGCEMCWLVC